MAGVVIVAFAALGALLAWGVYAVMDINALPPLGAALLGGLFGDSVAIKGLQSE